MHEQKHLIWILNALRKRDSACTISYNYAFSKRGQRGIFVADRGYIDVLEILCEFNKSVFSGGGGYRGSDQVTFPL